MVLYGFSLLMPEHSDILFASFSDFDTLLQLCHSVADPFLANWIVDIGHWALARYIKKCSKAKSKILMNNIKTKWWKCNKNK